MLSLRKRLITTSYQNNVITNKCNLNVLWRGVVVFLRSQQNIYIQSDNDAITARMSSIKVGAIHSEPNSLSEIQKLFRPWVITHICCFVAFSTQMVLISQEYIHPTQTVVNSKIQKLHLMEQLPVLFKVCVDVGVEEEKLKDLGFAK